jgi:membrane protease YdiL (CAAX protease family)
MHKRGDIMEHDFNKLKTLIYDFIFIAAGCICLYLYSMYSHHEWGIWDIILMAVAYVVLVVIIYLYPVRVKEDKHIYENKKAIIPFLIIFSIVLITIFTLNKAFGLNNSTLGNHIGYYLLVVLGFSSALFISYFFKVRLYEFNWDMPFRSFILVILLYAIFRLITNFIGNYEGTIHLSNIFNIQFILQFIISTIAKSIYPGIFEEVLYRGFFISALKGFGLSNQKCNIIQAVLFGIGHVMSWGTASWVFLLSTAGQAMMGYVLGKVYFKTKSLLPCILLHGLLDAM